MVNYVDATAPEFWRVLRTFARSLTYTPHGGTAQSVMGFATGNRATELFASALQYDITAVLDVEGFRDAFGATATPRKFDRLVTGGRTYAVEEWRGEPQEDSPILFRVLLRGGAQ